jgi:hypothetical protein
MRSAFVVIGEFSGSEPGCVDGSILGYIQYMDQRTKPLRRAVISWRQKKRGRKKQTTDVQEAPHL